MAAPSSTVWGSIVTGNTSGRKGRIGIYTKVTNTNTQTTVNVQVWFWTIWSCYDSYNSLYYNAGTSVTAATTLIGAIDINHTTDGGTGWNTANQTKLLDKTYTYTRTTSATTYKVYAKYNGIDMLPSSTMYVNTSYTVPALASYTVAYNANGGSGAPTSQTKWYGKTLTLSSTKPTRTGYSFQGWATSASGSVTYASGASYTANATVTLYAVWKANTYTVTYNANGGSGAPSKQTKTYGVALTLSSTIPTRTNYNFLGWGTSASATTVSYKAGASYTKNAAITLYAIWELAYIKPIIYDYSVVRCDAEGNEKEDGNGTCALVKFNWECTYDVSSITITWTSTAGFGSMDITASGTSGNVSQIIGDSALGTDTTYTVTVTVADTTDSSDATKTLNGLIFPVDFLAGGRGVAFGKPAELEGVADFALDAKFNGSVYGVVEGLNKLPAIPENANLDDYMEPGVWAIQSNAIAKTIANIPVAMAGRLIVYSSTGEGLRSQQWSYLRQKYIPYNSANPTWERDISRGEDNVWVYYEWYRSNLSMSSSNFVYQGTKILWGANLTTGTGMYMTEGHTINLSEPVSSQRSGIVLVFCAYNGTDDTNYGYQSFFVPKQLVALTTSAHTFTLSRGKFSYTGTKYLYINDSSISGHVDNSATGTANGITYANNKFVLRYVIGV